MKCVECPYHSYDYGTHWCDVKPKKPKRIIEPQAIMDLPCDDYEKRKKKDAKS